MLAQIAHYSSNVTLSLSRWLLHVACCSRRRHLFPPRSASALHRFHQYGSWLQHLAPSENKIGSPWLSHASAVRTPPARPAGMVRHLRSTGRPAVCAPVVNRDVNQLELGRRPWSSPTLDLGRRSRVEEREVDPESGDYAPTCGRQKGLLCVHMHLLTCSTSLIIRANNQPSTTALAPCDPEHTEISILPLKKRRN